MGPNMSHRSLGFVGLAGALALLALPALAQTQDPAPPPLAAQPTPVSAKGPARFLSVTVEVGTGKMVELPQRVASVFAADPAIAEVRPASPSKLFVFGRSAGETTVVATDTAGNTIAQYTVVVNASNYSNDATRQQANKISPGSDVHVDLLPGGGVLNGTVDTPQQAYLVNKQAQAAGGGTLVNNLEVRQSIQVALKVRIASMSRTVTRTLGIDWATAGNIAIGKFGINASLPTGQASTLTGSTPASLGVTFPGGTFEGVIDALAEDNLAHILAEPTLTTLSGTTATFQSGGQFPIGVASNSGGVTTVTITFKDYGVLLSFTPVVMSDGRISLSVAPQFVAVDASHAVTIDGTSEPSFQRTSASSTVILGSGEGMAIAGLLLDQSSQTDNAVPGLGEMPVIGALFRGDEYQREQQELVITVTPYLINPVTNPGALASPDDGWTPANDIQRILLLRNNGTDPTSPPSKIPGDAGFMVQ